MPVLDGSKSKVLVICNRVRNDPSLQQCLAYIAKSYEVIIRATRQGVRDEIERNTFDLIVVDFSLPNFMDEGLVKWIDEVDPDVPLILMISDKPLGTQRLHRQIRTIKYPFKPLKFVRLIDDVLQNQQNRYQQLVTMLNKIIDRLQEQTGTLCTFLIENSEPILIRNKALPDMIVYTLLHLAANKKGLRLPPGHSSKYGLYKITIIDNLHLVLLSPPNHHMDQVWEHVEVAALDIIITFHHYNHTLTPNQVTIRKQGFIPLNAEVAEVIDAFIETNVLRL